MVSSSPPIAAQRKLFSSVTKLGFAAGHDSPGLKIEETTALHNNGVTNDSTGFTDAACPLLKFYLLMSMHTLTPRSTICQTIWLRVWLCV